MAINLDTVKRIHFVGIKGVGMTALALCAQDLGIEVSGSDVEEVFVTDSVLKERDLTWKKGFSASNLSSKVDLVIATGAFGREDNPEIAEAKKRKIRVLMQGEAVSLFSREKEVVGICGVGGKTTTSAMVATVLEKAGEKPSYAIGVGRIFPLGYPGKYASGRHFICEADEYVNLPGVDETPKFLYLEPKVVVVTNIEHDHPDVYPSLKETQKAYFSFFKKIPKNGLLVANADNKNVRELIDGLNCRVITYGFLENADFVLKESKAKKGKLTFAVRNKLKGTRIISLKVPGGYNALNATAAYITADFLGVEEGKIIEGLESFLGTQRRFEVIGKTKAGALVIDDYAHHPKEIASVLEAARQFYADRRLVAVFQPHTYSRTKALFTDFAKCFGAADTVGLMDIYSSAREKKDKSVSLEKLAEKTTTNGTAAFYTGGHKETLTWLKENLKGGDVLMTLGAGDIFYLHKQLVVSEL